MKMMLRLGLLASVLSCLLVAGLAAASGVRYRAASTGDRPGYAGFVREHSCSWGSDSKSTGSPKTPSPLNMVMSRSFDAKRLIDPREFIKCILDLFDEDDGDFRLLRDLRDCLKLLAQEQSDGDLPDVSGGDDEDDLDAVSVRQGVVSVSNAETMIADDFWCYCHENEIFSGIKERMAVQEKGMAEAVSLSLLGTSVASGCRMMDDREGIIARNKAIIVFIEEREVAVREILSRPEEE